MRRLALIALPLALAACSQEPAEQTADEIADETAATDAGQQRPTDLDLSANGITIPAQGDFEQLDVPFGSMRAATETTLANVLGEATEQGGEPNECGLTFTSFPGFTANFRDDEFVGYWAEEPYVPALDRATMLEDPAVEPIESTLDGEFMITRNGQAISGIFSGEGDDATVARLWAGENCIAR
ncbi:MAG: hypothetical protein WBA68_02930 [Alteraurantiacibacter sp.]